MKYKEFKKAIKEWGKLYDYKPVLEIYLKSIEIVLEDEGYTDVICEVHKLKSSIIDLNWDSYVGLPENAKGHLFEIVTEFAKTKPEDREYEKRFIIPLPELVTTDGKQQYLTHKDCKFFASRRDERLRQTWKEEHLKNIPEIYRQFAVEFDEEKEY